MARDPDPVAPPDEGASLGDVEASADESAANEAPADERLAKLQAAFDRGDYAQVRALAAPLIAEGGPLAESASDLVQRTKVDPAQVGVLIGCVLFFCFIVWKYVL